MVLCGAVAVVAGVWLLAGDGVALIVGGVMAMAFGLTVNVDGGTRG